MGLLLDIPHLGAPSSPVTSTTTIIITNDNNKGAVAIGRSLLY
jgi:hypothetical protein